MSDILGGLMGVSVGGGVGLGSPSQQLPQYTNNGVIPPAPVMTISVLHTKLQQQGARMVDQLPMSVAHKIRTLDFYGADKERPARFVVTFQNGREIEFLDIDLFPTDEHIARIALECP